VESETGQIYINYLRTGNRIVLFVSENKKQDGVTSLNVYLGEVEYVRYEGNMPISFVWRLEEEMPAAMMRAANKSIM
jgi:hypothetical protein